MDKVVQRSESIRRQLRDPLSGGSESDRRMIFRRIEDARGTILLWEGSFHWQTSDSQLKYKVHDSGWALITPVVSQSGDVTLIRYGGSLEILTTDDPRLKTNNVLVTGIVRAIQSHLKSHISQVENVLLDSFHQQQSSQ